MNANMLDVVAVISNPRRFKRRYELFEKFINHMLKSGVRLTVVECTFGERPYYFEDKIPSEVNYVSVRTKHEIWVKENLINIGVQHLPKNWKYVAWVDGDIEFVNPNWACETVHMLQHHPVVQLFSHVVDLGPDYQIVSRTPDSDCPVMTDFSFCHQYIHEECIPTENEYHKTRGFWHPGFSWAATRDAWDIMGGLIDTSIVGSGDHQMACALINRVDLALHGKVSKEFKQMAYTWQEHCKSIHHQIGYVKGLILHFWHGPRVNRKYQTRWNILIESQYNPYKDVKYDHQGLLQLSTTNCKLMRDIQIYFQQRDEDSNHLG